jgi:hypothetical protein
VTAVDWPICWLPAMADYLGRHARPEPAGYCGAPDCSGDCTPAGPPECIVCGAPMPKMEAEMSAFVFGAAQCDVCLGRALPPSGGREW